MNEGDCTMKAKSNLKVVEAKEPEFNVLDKMNEVKMKHAFMSVAIDNLWGNEHSIYGEDVICGCHFLMNDIGDDLLKIHKALDPEYTK